MANKPKPQPESSRRATVEAMRRQQQRKERFKTMLFVGVAALVGLGLVAAAAVPAIIEARNDPAKKAYAEFGVAAAKADCDDVVDDKATGKNDHVAEGQIVNYKTAPPSSGQHAQATGPYDVPFFTPDDVPPVENLVHNLEHGFTILWYDETVKDAELEALEGLAKRARKDTTPPDRFIVAPWDTEARDEFPEGKHIALTHWSREAGRRQYCGKVSGEVVQEFVKAYPATDAPEGGA